MTTKPTPPALIEAAGVSKVFERKGAPAVEVLRGVNLSILPGDKIAILGKSGAGKSTLLHILGTLEEPSGGKITFEGKDIFNLGETELSSFRNRHLGFVFQFHYLMLEFTALENVMMPALIANVARNEASDRAENILGRVGLADRLTHKPSMLSGGEQQRVAIARALMMNPKLLLTDEMTGNLDTQTGAKVFDLVQRLHEEFRVALVSVTHDEALASSYRKTYRLNQGELQ